MRTHKTNGRIAQPRRRRQRKSPACALGVRLRFVETVRRPDACPCLRSRQERRTSPTRSGGRRRGALRRACAQALLVGRASPLASGRQPAHEIESRTAVHDRSCGSPGAGGFRQIRGVRFSHWRYQRGEVTQGYPNGCAYEARHGPDPTRSSATSVGGPRVDRGDSEGPQLIISDEGPRSLSRPRRAVHALRRACSRSPRWYPPLPRHLPAFWEARAVLVSPPVGRYSEREGAGIAGRARPSVRCWVG